MTVNEKGEWAVSKTLCVFCFGSSHPVDVCPRKAAGWIRWPVAAGIAAGCMEQQHLGWFWQWQQQHRGLQVPMSFFSVSRSPPPAESAA